MRKTMFIMVSAICALHFGTFADELYYGEGASAAFDLNMRCDGALAVEGVVHNGGTLAVDETWTTGNVHVVYGTLIIVEGVTLTIEPGAIIKFVAGGLYAAGRCVANGVTVTDIGDMARYP